MLSLRRPHVPDFIQKRRRRWYAVLEIPKDLRRHFGRARFVQSLETDSPKLAANKAALIVATWKSQIAAARNEPDSEVSFYRRALARAKTPQKKAAMLEQVEMAAWSIGAENVEAGAQPSGDPEARAFVAEATKPFVAFTEHLEEWLTTSRATAKTQDMQRSDVKRFAKEFKSVQDVQRPAVRRWITSLMNHDGLTPKTVQRILSALRGYWRYLQSINVAGEDDEPFQKLDVARDSKRRNPADERQPFEPRDVVRLWKEAKARDDQELADLIELDMYSGARIEELCALKLPNVAADHFKIDDAKTAAGWRKVPIHSKLRKTVARLKKASKDGYLLSGLPANKYGDRSNAIGKRFGYLKKAMGFGPQLVFHSIRKEVATQFENASVAENVAAGILGHDFPTMTFGSYSGGPSPALMRKAVEKLRYPSA
jgi:integrase